MLPREIVDKTRLTGNKKILGQIMDDSGRRCQLHGLSGLIGKDRRAIHRDAGNEFDDYLPSWALLLLQCSWRFTIGQYDVMYG
jgi:hypothetical protein